jgi:hypothetical protein
VAFGSSGNPAEAAPASTHRPPLVAEMVGNVLAKRSLLEQDGTGAAIDRRLPNGQQAHIELSSEDALKTGPNPATVTWFRILVTGATLGTKMKAQPLFSATFAQESTGEWSEQSETASSLTPPHLRHVNVSSLGVERFVGILKHGEEKVTHDKHVYGTTAKETAKAEIESSSVMVLHRVLAGKAIELTGDVLRDAYPEWARAQRRGLQSQ